MQAIWHFSAVISAICSICLISYDQHIASAEWKVRSEIFLKELLASLLIPKVTTRFMILLRDRNVYDSYIG